MTRHEAIDRLAQIDGLLKIADDEWRNALLREKQEIAVRLRSTPGSDTVTGENDG